MRKLLFTLVALFSFGWAQADCVYSADSKTTYQILEDGYRAKILFTGGYGPSFIIEIDGTIYDWNINTTTRVLLLKDSFCSYTNDVIVIGDEVFGVYSVTRL